MHLPKWAVYCLAYIIVIVALVLFARYIYLNRQEFEYLGKIDINLLVIASLFVIINYALNAYQLNLFLQHFSIFLSFGEALALTMSMMLGNFILPMRGGSGAMALYLRTVHKLDFQAFGAIYGGTAILVTLINSGLALVGLAYLYFFNGYHSWILTLITTASFCGTASLSLFAPSFKLPVGGPLGFFLQVADSWYTLSKNRVLLLRLSLSLLWTTLAILGVMFCIYIAVGKPLNFFSVLVISALGTIANLVPLTPGSLGFFEAVSVNVPLLFGVDTAVSLGTAALYRILTFAVALVAAIPSLFYLWYLRRSKSRNAD